MIWFRRSAKKLEGELGAAAIISEHEKAKKRRENPPQRKKRSGEEFLFSFGEILSGLFCLFCCYYFPYRIFSWLHIDLSPVQYIFSLLLIAVCFGYYFMNITRPSKVKAMEQELQQLRWEKSQGKF